MKETSSGLSCEVMASQGPCWTFVPGCFGCFCQLATTKDYNLQRRSGKVECFDAEKCSRCHDGDHLLPPVVEI